MTSCMRCRCVLKVLALAQGLFPITGCRTAQRDKPAAPKSEVSSTYDSVAEFLSASEKRGRDIWYKATLGNARFFTYVLPQRAGYTIPWHTILNSNNRGERFKRFGLISDPDCQPGTAESYGWDICPGDYLDGNGDSKASGLLAFVGNPGYEDPACQVDEFDLSATARSARGDTCALQFGTSAGVIGIRKFPNPKYEGNRDLTGLQYGGEFAGVKEGFTDAESANQSPTEALLDVTSEKAVEPPFLVGISCALCHVGMSPLHSPKSKDAIKWHELHDTFGNHQIQFAQMIIPEDAAGHFGHESFDVSSKKSSYFDRRLQSTPPGTSDTSILFFDGVESSVAIPAIHLESLAESKGEIKKWRQVKAPCNPLEKDCQCIEHNCYKRSLNQETIKPLLVGGEDDMGIDMALMRKYLSMGMCSELCVQNHLYDFRRMVSPVRHSPVSVRQCRRDCEKFRVLESRTDDLTAFLNVNRPYPLKDALGLTVDELISSPHVGGVEKFELGQKVFAASCAGCHGPDLSGNTKLRAAPKTHDCRMKVPYYSEGGIWQEFSKKSPVGSRQTRTYLPRPLTNVWASAPLLHNNSIGSSPCVSGFMRPETLHYLGEESNGCTQMADIDLSVEGRLLTFTNSLTALLNPQKRQRKILAFQNDTEVEGPRFFKGDTQVFSAQQGQGEPPGQMAPGFNVTLPKNTSFPAFSREELARFIEQAKMGALTGRERERFLAWVLDPVGGNSKVFAKSLSCKDVDLSQGHEFGTDLSALEKEAVIGYVKTL